MTFSWNQVVAGRASKLAPSAFSDLEGIRSVEDLIFFAGGTPPLEKLPIARLRQASADAWKNAADHLYYGESQGHEPLRHMIAERMTSRGATTDPEHVMITNGSQQGLDLIARTLFDPGDVVVIEGPTYFGAMQAFDAYEVTYRTAPVDDDGLIPDELERLLREHPRPKAIYTVPTFQNPTGVTISPERRRRVVELSLEYTVPIIEDDPYGELHFPGDPVPPLRALDSNVIYLGTFSKTLAPALRMGWMVMPEALIPPLVNSKEAVDIQSDRFVQRAVVRACADGWLDAHLDEARALYQARCQRMIAALQREMPPGTRWITPQGGFFVWVTLTSEITSNALLPTAGKHGVAYLPGSAFYPDRRKEPTLRLGFSTLSDDKIDEGIHRLGRATAEFLG
ncbi:PLP-dependent aminotransferase family protein [soil metagenome]